jgi:hypothetical protein
MKIHTTKLYDPSNGEKNSAEISVEIPNGTGDISLSIHKAGSNNHILGPNGWQSADYWFNGTPSEVSKDNIAWFSLPTQLVEHITYSNYSVFCRRIGNTTSTRTILTGGALVAKPSHANVPKGDIELPPLPTGFSQASLGSLAAVDKRPEVSAVQPDAVVSPVVDSEVQAPIIEQIAAPPEAKQSAVIDAPIPKQAPSSSPEKPLSKSNMPILLGVSAAILLVIAVYFYGLRDTSKNDGVISAQPSAPVNKPEFQPTPPVEKAPEPEPTKPAPSPTPESKVTKSSASELKQPTKKSPTNTPVEPTKPAPTPEKAQPPVPSVQPTNTPVEPAKPAPAPEKAQPPAPSVPDLNRMVNEALKR